MINYKIHKLIIIQIKVVILQAFLNEREKDIVMDVL